MEFGTLVRQVQVNAPPAVVYDVVSSPEHIARWWADAADVEAVSGAAGTLDFHDRRVHLTVVEAVPGDVFAFRWNHPEHATPTPDNSLLVTFKLTAQGGGTLLEVTEEGMREQGWEAAVLEEYYQSHGRGWDTCMARITTYVAELRASR